MEEEQVVSFSLGRMAFESYKSCVGHLSYDGRQVPNWDQLETGIQAGWNAAAHEVYAYAATQLA